MCGRMACNLCREEYQSACSYLDKSSNVYVKPPWINIDNAGAAFRPSNNTCPSDVTPVLVSGSSFAELNDESSDRYIAPMLWGLIPRWHKGNPKQHGLSTTNCRLEGIKNVDSKGASKLYASPLREGKRCIVICEGYYEWQTTKETKNKQPYYIYATQEKHIRVEDTENWKNAEWSANDGWKGPALLKLAAVFDCWSNDSGEKIYSYSIITMESNQTLSWLHHRMPAVLTDENVVQDWLDTERVSASRAISLLSPTPNLAWHPVSTAVNNSRNKDSDCNKPLKEKKESFSPLKNWLQTGTLKKRPSTFDDAVGSKKSKD